MGVSSGLHLQNICSNDSNKKLFRSFAPKTTALEQFPSGPVDFSDIRDFSKIAVFMNFDGHFNIPVMGTISWV